MEKEKKENRAKSFMSLTSAVAGTNVISDVCKSFFREYKQAILNMWENIFKKGEKKKSLNL